MAEYIYLRPNSEKFNLNYVELGDGSVYESTIFEPGEIWFDQQGLIRQFSRRFDNGDVGNFFLMPLDKNNNKYISIISSDLAEFGIKMIGDALFQGGGMVVNLAKFFFKKYGKVTVTDLARLDSNGQFGYVAIDNNEVVFRGKLTMNMGDYLSNVLFTVRNNCGMDIKYQTSRDDRNWTQWIVQDQHYIEHYFGNNQQIGYLRIYTNNLGFKHYEVRAQDDYTIMWNESLGRWGLFLT